MNKHLSLLILLSSLFSAHANALLIDNDFFTTDTTSGLDWLDLNRTIGRSYSDVSGSFINGEFAGWRYATANELNGLVSSAAGYSTSSDKFSNTYTFFTEVNDVSAADLLNDLLGTTFETGTGLRRVSGTLGDVSSWPQGGRHITGVIWDDDRSSNSEDWFRIHDAGTYDGQTYDTFGSYLVRATQVPEPSGLALLIFGLSFFGFFRIKYK